MDAFEYEVRPREVICEVCGEPYIVEGFVSAGQFFSDDECPGCIARALRERIVLGQWKKRKADQQARNEARKRQRQAVA